MKVAQINIVGKGSTGNIMLNIANILRMNGNNAKTFSAKLYIKKQKHLPAPPEGHSYFGSRFENMIHIILGRITGINGMFSYFGTRKLIAELKQFKPDVIHLHNLHTFCINLPMLFGYIKKEKIPVVWTLHDCWSFTGHCAHFVMAKCDKWKTECHKCPQLANDNKFHVDNTRTAYRLKKKWFCGVENMTLVTPSRWLAELAKASFLSGYPIEVINNGINLSVFKPVESDFRTRNDLEGKRIVLGVVGSWSKGKGVDVFVELAKRLDDDYRVVVVGASTSLESDNERLIIIPRTANQQELAEIYSTADVFVNPTREDTFPTVNIEALACGTPLVTFRTGGSPEIIDETCGSVVEVDDVDALEKEIIRVCSDAPFSREACLKRAEGYDMYERFGDYISLYERITSR